MRTRPDMRLRQYAWRWSIRRFLFFFYRYGDPRDLHSFPTRRSSDLIVVVVHGEGGSGGALGIAIGDRILMHERSEEHTFELQSRRDLVCRLLLEKKKTWNSPPHHAAKPARLLHARRGHGRRCHPRRT